MQKTKLISIIAVSLIILAIITFKFLVPGFKNNSNTPNDNTDQKNSIGVKAAPVAVEAVPAQRGDLVIRISRFGQDRSCALDCSHAQSERDYCRFAGE